MKRYVKNQIPTDDLAGKKVGSCYPTFNRLNLDLAILHLTD